jgi:hypothetical protein
MPTYSPSAWRDWAYASHVDTFCRFGYNGATAGHGHRATFTSCDGVPVLNASQSLGLTVESSLYLLEGKR